ncbi:hypothetical protein KDA_75050 [Dictyobacter alpinus]|uniref:Uncharacterized protein n=1 Tax=Dictyobacter alpinus TaxID=2014873 RepID=A0A402BL04_9CHLR|nr:hypothetical protein [Dictyobacter alpinus]GCE32021.1 hypothetical protein KDA_75050 [Dictyobacter alpinus]
MAKIPRKKSSPKAGSVCEYGTVAAFLNALSEQSKAEVLLAPAYRTTGNSIQAGALLSGQRSDETSRVHACIVLAVEAILGGSQGRITYPYRQTQHDQQVRKRIRDLQDELLTALQLALQHDERVAHLRYPASYQVPAIQIWHPDALAVFPVAYQDGRWVVVSSTRGQLA